MGRIARTFDVTGLQETIRKYRRAFAGGWLRTAFVIRISFIGVTYVRGAKSIEFNCG
jgi:hypothetical protein